VLGNAIGVVVFFLDLFKQAPWIRVLVLHRKLTGIELTSMIASFYLCVFCGLIILVVSHLFPEPLKEEARPLVWEDWREPLRGDPHGRGLGDYRVLSAVVVATFVLLYYLFR
jgi:hypothetical protein